MSNQSSKVMLHGIKVIDLTSVVFGPYLTQNLADLGAEVIKVEPPTGDMFRYATKSAVTPGMGPCYLSINGGKKSVVLDLKDPSDVAVMRSLLQDADVFVHNVRGRAIEKLGFSYDAVKAIKPDIIYIHCVGFGQDGPYRDLQAYDDVIQAASGTTSLLSRVDGNPKPRYLPSLIADKVAGLHGTSAALAAIIHKLRTGEGQHVEVPMFEAFSHFMLLEHLAGQTFDPPNGPACYPRQIDPDRQPFQTSDGAISIVIYTDTAFFLIFEILGDADFLKDPMFATVRDRFANIATIYRRIAELTPNFTTAHLVAACQAADMPAQPARDISDIMTDEHLVATQFFRKRQHPSEGAYYDLRPPVRYSAMEETLRTFPSRLDEDGEVVRERLKK